MSEDYVQAYVWNSLAAANSTGEVQNIAAREQEGFARRLTSAQLAEAQRLAQEWTKVFEKRQVKK